MPLVLEFDHVIVAVRDLHVAAARFLAEYGLASVPGGRHEGHGTGNAIVPLGSEYLELMAVVDATEGATSLVASWLQGRLAEGEGAVALCLRTDDLDGLAARLDLEPLAMTRRTPDGMTLGWRLVGLPQALTEGLPFFIQWNIPESLHPGRTSVSHRVEATGIAWVEMGGDEDRLRSWLGDHTLPLQVVAGPPGVRRVGVATAKGTVVIDAPGS